MDNAQTAESDGASRWETPRQALAHVLSLEFQSCVKIMLRTASGELTDADTLPNDGVVQVGIVRPSSGWARIIWDATYFSREELKAALQADYPLPIGECDIPD